MTFSSTEMWLHMGPLARGIVCTMLVMGLAALVVMVERLWTLSRSQRRSRAFAERMAGLLADGDMDAAAKAPPAEQPGHLGNVIQTAFTAYRQCPHRDEDLTFESVARALERQAQREVHNLKRGLGVLATIASTAPFIGLLGTVVGIVNAFISMAQSGSGGLSTVSAGIAEALATTAIGLFIAIPAMGVYNAFSSWTDARAVDIAEASNELLDMLHHHLRRTPGSRPERGSVSSLRPAPANVNAAEG